MNKIDKIIGPVIPIPTPFKTDESLDLDALYSYITFLAESGIGGVMTTVGTSRFNLLTPDEVKQVNETLVKAGKGKIKTIVANPLTGSTKQAIDFAHHAEQIGADFLLLYYPERYYGDEGLLNFFKEVHNQSNIDILIHEMPMRNGLGGGQIQYPLHVLKELLELPRLVGFKEEALDADYSNKIVDAFHKDAVIIGAGGGMSRYLNRDFDRGSKSFLGGIGGFEPQLEVDFFNALNRGDKVLATKIVEETELPYFQEVVPMGWHPSLKVALALKGFMSITERKPMKQVSEQEVAHMKTLMTKNGWL